MIGELAGKPALAEAARDDRGAPDRGPAARRRAGCWSGSSSTPTSPTTCRATSSCAASSAPTRRPAQVAVGADVHPGQVVRLHARDADERRPRPARGAVDAHDARSAGARRRARCVFACNGRGRGDVRARRPRRRGGRRRARAARRPPASSPRARSARSAASYFLHGFTATVAVFARLNLGGRARPAHRRDRRARAGDRAGAGRARARGSTLTGRRADVLEPLAAEVGGAARSRATSPTRTRRRALLGEAGEVDVLVANAGAAGQRRAELVQRRGDRPRAGGQPARADGAGARAVGGRWSRAATATSCSCPRCRGKARRAGQLGLLGDEVRAARRSRSACARTSRARASASPCIFPGFIRDAGMFAESGARAAAATSATQAARGRRARASSGRSSTTAPSSTSRRSPLRAGACSPASRPGPSARVQRRLGADGDRRADRRGPARQALARRAPPRPAAPRRVRARPRASSRRRPSRSTAPTAARTSSASRGPSSSRSGVACDAHDDLVGVDLLERDRRLAADRRARSRSLEQRLDVARA